MKNKKTPQQSVFKEAWDNMSDDFSRFIPEKMHHRKGKMKWFVLLSLVEILVLGVLGKLAYDWLMG